jgi:hypothetical protein
MAGATARLVQRCEERGRDSEPVQESVARLLHAYDDASPVQRRELYGRALYLQYGLLLEAMANDHHLLQEAQSTREQWGVLPNGEESSQRDRVDLRARSGTTESVRHV